jgi:hypothetical protein
MSNFTLQLMLWFAAGLILVVLLARRRSRKALR